MTEERYPFVWFSGEATLEFVQLHNGKAPPGWTIDKPTPPSQWSHHAWEHSKPVHTRKHLFERHEIIHRGVARRVYVERRSGFTSERLIAILERASVEVMNPPTPPEPGIALTVEIPLEMAESFRSFYGSGARKAMANAAERGAFRELQALHDAIKGTR